MSVISDVIDKVKQTDPNQPEFHQAVEEVMETLEPTVKKHPEYVKAKIYERIVEPERAMQFRVPWVDDKGNVVVNPGHSELHCSVRFHNALIDIGLDIFRVFFNCRFQCLHNFFNSLMKLRLVGICLFDFGDNITDY